MQLSDPLSVGTRWAVVFLATLAGVAAGGVPLVPHHRADIRRCGLAACTALDAAAASRAPTAPGFMTDARISSPVAPVARFSVDSRAAVADLMSARRAEALVVMRVGSLYGP